MWIDEWVEKEGMLLKQFAEQIGVDIPMLWRIRRKKSPISKNMAKKIYKLTRGEITYEEIFKEEKK